MKKWQIILLITVMAIGCKKPYNPPVIAAKNNYLVVEGVINAGADSTTITLSRTVNLSNKTTVNPELHAIVAIQSDANVSYPLTETTKGNYVSAGLNLSSTHNYRLSIKTSNNEEYLSDYVPVKNSPPIDSVTYNTKGNSATPGLNVFVNTHDPKNNTTYYRWDYQETWIFTSNFDSQYVSNGDTILPRPISDQIYECWKTDSSSTIIVNSSAKLTSDVITNNPIAFVNSTSEKLGTEYSILVRQYALTADAYTFWTNLKKNTEQLGSIFDAQPSQINGNIHCKTNPLEPVIGYLSIGIPSTQRIFIENRVLPAWSATPFYTNCTLDTFGYKHPGINLGDPPVNWVDEYLNYDSSTFIGILFLSVDPIQPPGSPIIGYSGSQPRCVDCTLRGTNKQPSFWKN
jgi:hypothetical protein